jgi:sulfite oxidase
MTIDRRKFVAALGTSLLSGAPADTANQFIVRSPRPTDLEMSREGFRDWVTPVEHFFVRCHTYFPERANLAQWSLRLDGAVERPLAMSMTDLKSLPRVELVAVLECAGNGRSFYRPRVAGTQWEFGSVGNGRWVGVRLRDVLMKSGLKDSAKEILLDGADSPLGTMPKFQRTIPLDKALDPFTLLAFEMNGRELPLEHGFPVRLIASGWAGDSWVKWLRGIQVLDREFEGFWMKTAYRHPVRPIEPGAAVDPAEMVPVTDLNIKSVIAAPSTGWIEPGRVKIAGAAWSNSSPVTKVEVSLDGGRAWRQATLHKNSSQYSWRLWELDWRAQTGKYTLLARATNANGKTQPLNQEWNPNGYLWNVAQPVDVQVGGAKPVPASQARTVAHPAGYDATCLTCHDESMMRQQRLSRPQWEREVNKMTGWGARINPADREAILNYLSDSFRP